MNSWFHTLAFVTPSMSLADQLRAEGEARGEQRGEQRGILKGKLIARIESFQELLGQPVSTDETLSALELERLQEMLQQLQARLRERPA